MTAIFNPYKILGIRRDSGAKRIKKAFRDTAKRAHPDVGGSVEAFHAIRRAYTILSDPERRAKYDETGQIDETTALSFENHVAAMLISLFEEFVRSGKAFKRDVDVIEAMRRAAEHKVGQANEAKRGNAELIAPLVGLKTRISRRDGDNIFARTLDRRISQLHEHSAKLDEQTALMKGVLAELDNYDCVTEMVRHHAVFAFGGTSAATATTTGAF